jgi:hypothetical protein
VNKNGPPGRIPLKTMLNPGNELSGAFTSELHRLPSGGADELFRLSILIRMAIPPARLWLF